MDNARLEKVIEKYADGGRENLIPILQDMQDEFGFLSFDSLLSVSRHLGIALSKVYGVASFYNQFKFKEPGKYQIQVCRGTACHVKGSLAVLESIKRYLEIEPGDTTKDKMFSLEVVACVGACSLAPVVCINGEYHADLNPEKMENVLKEYQKREEELQA